jgi:hypothetical protein
LNKGGRKVTGTWPVATCRYVIWFGKREEYAANLLMKINAYFSIKYLFFGAQNLILGGGGDGLSLGELATYPLHTFRPPLSSTGTMLPLAYFIFFHPQPPI